jgi:ABC-type bacteriocin/lantibiotic exporter with double-glycine peptidase domain
VALVGRTGSGKTTLAKVILGLYVPSEGQVRFDGRMLQDLDFRDLRRWCGMVTQEPSLFAGSIRENICLGRPNATYDEVVLAAQRAQIYDEIMAMPMAFETRLTEGGGGLSGGQRQRLALARALVHNPPLLLLDEATSHLDVVTERRVDEVLSALSCTRIVIAHRLSTVVNADLIGVMEDGRLVEQGTHEELIAHRGRYEALIRDQLQTAQPR